MRTKAMIQSDQWAAIDRLVDRDETLLIAPKGFGKCMVAYTAIIERLHLGLNRRVLVLSTANVCSDTWAREPDDWPHLREYKAACLTGMTPEQRMDAIYSDAPIIICNFELLLWLLDLEHFDFDGLVVDELTKLKSVGGKGYMKLRKLIAGKKDSPFTFRAGLTADPVAQDQIDIYGQVLVIDGGKALGRNKDTFLRKYFMAEDYSQRKWIYQPNGQARLTRALSDVVYRVDPTEYKAKLPELRMHEVFVDIDPRARKVYMALIRDGEAMVNGHLVEAVNSGVLWGKLLQLANGGLYYNTEIESKDADGRTVYDFVTACEIFSYDKIDAARNIVESIEGPVLITYEYNFQREMLQYGFDAPVYEAALSKAKKAKLLSDWETGKVPVMLCHPKSAGHGVNLQYGPCRTLINMTAYKSADEYDQVIGRLWRRGQTAPWIDVYDIICTGTVEDNDIIPRLESRVEESKAFDEYLRKVAEC